MTRAQFALRLGSFVPAQWCSAAAADASMRKTTIWYAETLHGRKIMVGQGAHSVLPAASIIKLLVASTLVYAVGNGDVTLDSPISLRTVDRVGGSDRYGAVRPGAYPLRDLLNAMLSLSDNTAANALLRAAGMKRCNANAARLGLVATRIRRTFYDWEAQRRGLENTTTPFESAKLLADLFALTARSGGAGKAAAVVMMALLAQTDRETIPSALAGTTVANKTGELPGVRNDVGIVDYGGPGAYVVAIMCSYGGSEVRRGGAIREIRGVARQIDRCMRAARYGPRPKGSAAPDRTGQVR